MSREEIVKKGKYYTVIQGSFRVQVPQEHPDAVRRDWKSADGTKSGTKYERIVNALFGRIEEVSFHDGDYGMQVYIKLDENEDQENPIIALPTASREGEDFLKKLPNIDLTKEVHLRPFNFEGDGGDEVRGMEVMQQDNEGNFKVKITNFFRDKEAKKNINGYPDPESSDLSKDEWKLYFLQARMFLIKYTKENILPKFSGLAFTEDDENFAASKDSKETPSIKNSRPNIVKQLSKEEIEEGINTDEVPF